MPTKSIRLSQELFDHASRAGRLHHRSATGQVEYWAELGRSVERFLDPVDVLKLTSGAAKLVVKARSSRSVPADEVLADLEALRESGELRDAVCGASVRYQASVKHRGYLERLGSNGKKVVGRFVDGEFVEGL